jgi:DNA-binding transcriptional ArsR family regulator
MTEINLLTFTKAIADETRQEIMGHLCCVWCNVTEIVEKLDGKVNQPTVSHHLKTLQDANLVLVRHEGKHRYYTLNEQFMTVCCGQLMSTFAPSYKANIVSVSDIPVVD